MAGRLRLNIERLEHRALLASTRFAVIGDYGTGDDNEAAVAAMVKSWDPDLILTVGDNNYGIGAAETIDQNIGKYYQEFIADYQGGYGLGSPTNRFFPTLGNHDWWRPGLESIAPYLDYFNLPGTGFMSSSGNERYYDFRWGDIHFFALDSCLGEPDGRRVDSVQARWLQTELTRSTARWQFVYFHEAAYTSGPDSGDTVDMQWPLSLWGADAVFQGHEHMYERLWVDNIPYFISGLGGAVPRGLGAIDPHSVFHWVDGQGAMLVTVNGDSTVFEFYSVESGGTLIDRYVTNPRAFVTAKPFYNSSAFDAAGDDNAIATDKRPLFAGQRAAFANYTSYDRGLNGLVLEFDGDAPPDRLTAADFQVRVGNIDNPLQWSLGPAPSTVTIQHGMASGTHRVYLTWPDHAVENTWLELTVLATAATALEDPVAFYYGNAVGESGNFSTDALVDWGDVWGPTIGSNHPVVVDDPFDYNRDGRRNAGDAAIALTRLGIVSGDLNADDRFGVRDLLLWRTAFGAVDPISRRRADQDADGRLTRLDMAFSSLDYGQTAHEAMLARRLPLILPAPAVPSPPDSLRADAQPAIRGRRADVAIVHAPPASIAAPFAAVRRPLRARGLRKE
jgi:hypothetical protein